MFAAPGISVCDTKVNHTKRRKHRQKDGQKTWS